MKIEITLDKAKETELLSIIDKRVDGIIKLDERRKKALMKSIVTLALHKDDVLTSVLKNMGNREFFIMVGANYKLYGIKK